MAKRNFDDRMSIIHLEPDRTPAKKLHIDEDKPAPGTQLVLPVRMLQKGVELTPVDGLADGEKPGFGELGHEQPDVDDSHETSSNRVVEPEGDPHRFSWGNFGHEQAWADLPRVVLHTNQAMLRDCQAGICDVHHPTGLEFWKPVVGIPDARFGHDYYGEPSDCEDDLLIYDGSESSCDSEDNMVHESRQEELQYIVAELEQFHEDQEWWVEQCLDLQSELDDKSRDGSEEASEDDEVLALREERDRAVEANLRLVKEVTQLKQGLSPVEVENRRLKELVQNLKNRDQDENNPHVHPHRKQYRIGITIGGLAGEDVAETLPVWDELHALISEEVDIETFKVRDPKSTDASTQVDADSMDTSDDVGHGVLEDNAPGRGKGLQLEVTGKPSSTLVQDLTYNCGCVRPMDFMEELIFKRTLKNKAPVLKLVWESSESYPHPQQTESEATDLNVFEKERRARHGNGRRREKLPPGAWQR